MTVDELPEGLDVIGEIERPVFKVRPAGAGSPGANGEETQGEAENRSFARVSPKLRLRGHGSCLYPRRCLQTSLSGRRRWIITAGPAFPWIMETSGSTEHSSNYKNRVLGTNNALK